MKRGFCFFYVFFLVILIMIVVNDQNTAVKEVAHQTEKPVKNEFMHKIENITIKTNYNSVNFNWINPELLSSKTINFEIEVVDLPENTELIIQHISLKVLLKSEYDFWNDSTQSSSDFDDVIVLNKKYPYTRSFFIEGVPNSLIKRWRTFARSGRFADELLTENNFKDRAKIQGIYFQISIDLKVKQEGEGTYHSQILDLIE